MVMVLVHLLQLPDTFGHAAHEFRCCEHQTSRRSDQLRPGNAARLTGVSQSQQRTREPQQGQSRGQQPATRQTRTGQRQRCAAEPIPARSAQEEGFAYRVSFLPSPEWEQKRARDAKKKTHLGSSRAVSPACPAALPPLRLEVARSPAHLASPVRNDIAGSLGRMQPRCQQYRGGSPPHAAPVPHATRASERGFPP